MSDLDTQITELVERDPGQVPPPDLARLRAAGRRTLARRRLGVGTAALAMTVAVLAPAYAVVNAFESDGGSTPDSTATEPAAAGPTAPPQVECGLLTCSPVGSPERAEVTGEPLVVSSAGRLAEVLYAADEWLFIGHRRDGELFRTATTMHVDGDVRFWSHVGAVGADGAAKPDRLVVVGFVEGAPDEISWATPEGASGTVDLTSTAVVPGATVFALSAPLPKGYRPSTFERVRTADGRRAVKVTPGSDHPELTIRTSDGWSCSLAECGSLG